MPRQHHDLCNLPSWPRVRIYECIILSPQQTDEPLLQWEPNKGLGEYGLTHLANETDLNPALSGNDLHDIVQLRLFKQDRESASFYDHSRLRRLEGGRQLSNTRLSGKLVQSLPLG